MVQNAVMSGSSVVQCAFMYDFELAWGKWYRSKERKGAWGSYMLNKKWTLEEEFNQHMMMFQQVRVSSNYFIKVHFCISVWIGDR